MFTGRQIDRQTDRWTDGDKLSELFWDLDRTRGLDGVRFGGVG